MPKLQVSYKTLKLTNVLIANMSSEDIQDIAFSDKMENYIKTKGYQPVGPIVQHMGVLESGSGQVDINVQILRQSSGYINKTEDPYAMEAVLRVPNCLYVRFIGPQDRLNIAYQKLAVHAYEEEIELTGSTYTVFVKQMGDEDIVADIFMERAHD